MALLVFLLQTQFILTILLLTFLLISPTHSVNCPHVCKCNWILDSLEVDCSNKKLTDYPIFENIPIEHLDLSGNNFTEFPTQLSTIESLIHLDLSYNQISTIDQDALEGFVSLRTLFLANNSIKDWTSINPNNAFRHARNLKHLSLSGNQLGTFSDQRPKNLLISESLRNLELKNCGITTVSGDIIRNGLPKLERLTLSNNPLTILNALPSKSLRYLELSNCNIQRINSYLIQGLPNLEILNLSWNIALQFLTNTDGIISWETLTELDVSYCNLDRLLLSGLPALKTLRARGNMLRTLNERTFLNNKQLENIDMAKNALRFIAVDVFNDLKRLLTLDLSYNEIAQLDKDIFRTNDALVALNLSQNVIAKFTKLVSNSLREISFSSCEIIDINITALSGLSVIQRLDLSNNLIKEFPGGMRSETLQKLDLSNCRLSYLRNNTFREFPELASLYLNGNRFTSPFPDEVFRNNKFLDNIWIGDNPWVCNCLDKRFIDFYDYLIAQPAKLKDERNVRCTSPHEFYGKHWDAACAPFWTTSERSSNIGKAWSWILALLILGGVSFCCYTCFNSYMQSRKQRHNHREFRRNQEEMNEIRRQNQRMLENDGAPNAPSIFETNLPSYEDALNMPKPVRSSKSMGDLTAAQRIRRKIQRSRTEPEEDRISEEDEDLNLDYTQRFRSEDMLSNRDRERTAQIGPVRRTGYVEYNPTTRRFSNEQSRFPAAHVKAQNMQSAEQIANFQSYENSPYTKRRPKIAEIPPFKRATLRSDSVDFLTDPEFEANSKPGSPFARRKPKATVEPTIQNSAQSNVSIDATGKLPPAIENYYGSMKKLRLADSVDSDFQEITAPDITSLHDSNCSASNSSIDGGGDGGSKIDVEKRRKRKNSNSRRASGNFTAAAAAAEGDTSSSDREPMVMVHKPMRETLF